MPPLVMDRPPYYSVSRGSAPRSSAPRGGQDPRTGMERLPPVLPSSQSLPIGRQDELPPLRNTRLPPIQDSDTSQHAYYRPYPSSPDRPVMNAMRRPSPPLSVPVGMVSADYMPPRRSPGESFPPPFHPSHTRHPDPFRREVLPGHVSSHVPHHLRYDDPSAHMRHLSENESTQAGTPIKRPRVSLACLACRNRKSRCDGVRPTCKTCASMKIECKWPEVDFRRAKTGDAARARKRSPGDPSSQRSPEFVGHKDHGTNEIAANAYAHSSLERGLSTALNPSQSMPVIPSGESSLPRTASSGASPPSGHYNRYRTHSDADREARYADTTVPVSRSPSGRHMLPPLAHENRSAMHGSSDGHRGSNSSTDATTSRYASASWMRDHRAEPQHQNRRVPWETQPNPPARAVPESREKRASAAATRSRHRAAEIAILARPATDAQRMAVEAHMSRESSLEDLADGKSAGERLDRAFAADWDAVGGLSHAARRPFMDVAAGIIGILEIFETDSNRGPSRPSADAGARLHVLRLRSSPIFHSDLRHLSISADLSPQQEREVLQSASPAYDTLSYPIPVDRLSSSLVDSIQPALSKARAKANEITSGTKNASSNPSPAQAASLPLADNIPFVRQEDVKPPQSILELFFQAYTKAIGDQMPGLDTVVVGARIRNGSISALLANALCGIGASLFERAGQRPPIIEAVSSKVYIDRARALIGAALQSPDLEAILALGVMAIRDILMGQMVSSAAIISSAIRLCMQLDLHRAPPSQHRQPSPASEAASRQASGDNERGRASDLVAEDVFWMTFCLDRITAIATARPLAIKDRDIETAFPSTIRNGEPCIFAALVRQLHYLGRLAEVAISSPVGAASGGSAERERAQEMEIAAIGDDLVAHYESLPAVLHLSSANLGRAHDKGEGLSFLQLHLTHNKALLHRFLLSQAPMTKSEYDAMRSAARKTVEICLLGEALDPEMLADTPLSAVACFLAGCVWLAEIELLEDAMQQPVMDTDGASRSMQTELDSARSDLNKLMETMSRHAKFWPVARELVDVLEMQLARTSSVAVSPATVASLVGQIEAVHVLVRRPDHRPPEAAAQAPIRVRRVNDLSTLRDTFPQLC